MFERLRFLCVVPDGKDVIEHYDKHLNLGLTDKEKSDLIEYLKSI